MPSVTELKRAVDDTWEIYSLARNKVLPRDPDVPWDEFVQSLRDLSPLEDAYIAARRAHFEAIEVRLESLVDWEVAAEVEQ